MYKNIASIYNTFLWPEFSQDLFERLEIFLYRWKINTHHDIACGLGDFVYLATKTGINSSGSDISKNMIVQARKKYPQLDFSISDMRRFELKKKVDFITCNFDSINHLLKFSDWAETFVRVYNNLESDGKFLFDINTLEIVRNHKRGNNILINGNKMNIKIYPKKNDILVFEIEAEIKDGGVKNILKEIVYETSFEYKKIKKELLNIGFKKVNLFNKELGFADATKRKYILAEK